MVAQYCITRLKDPTEVRPCVEDLIRRRGGFVVHHTVVLVRPGGAKCAGQRHLRICHYPFPMRTTGGLYIQDRELHKV
jgi:hypothetical protein